MTSRAAVQEFLANIIAQAMYMSPSEIGETELFSNFGLESLTLVKLTKKLNQHFGLDLNVKGILQHQTLRDAASYVHGELVAQHANQQEEQHG